MCKDQPTKGEILREATSNLKGMVADTTSGTLVIREPEVGETALKRDERRRIGKYFELGLSDPQIAGVLDTW